MKVLFFANTDWYLYNFRLPLIKHVQELGHEVVVVSPDGQYAERFKSMGILWVPINMKRRSMNPFSEIGVLMRLLYIFNKHKPDVVHNFTLKCVVYGSLAAVLLRIKRIINGITGMGYAYSSTSTRARYLKVLLTSLMRLLFKSKAVVVIVQNEDDFSFLLEKNMVAESKLRLIRGSGVNLARYTPSISNDSNQKLVVLMATRLLEEKGVREYVAASIQVSDNKPHATFLLAGNPDPGNPSSISLQELELWQEGGIPTILGHVENMPELMKKVDIVVLPSYYGEGIPRVLLEAAASGLPIVTTTSPGCREAVDSGSTGILVPPKDTPKLADAIERLLDSSTLRQKMGQAGRLKAENMFSETRVLEETIATYGFH
jgi:glycosyltransferase involved in cell wall biosynthesis